VGVGVGVGVGIGVVADGKAGELLPPPPQPDKAALKPTVTNEVATSLSRTRIKIP
jgi:hypothetical protein